MKLDNQKITRLLLVALAALCISPLLAYQGEFTSFLMQVSSVDGLTTDNSAIIQRQRLYLGITLFVILILAGLTYYTYKLNQKLRKNENAQKEINQRIIAVVNNTDSIIVSLSKEGDIRMINDALINLYKNWMNIDLKAGDNILEATKGTNVHPIWESWIAKSHGVAAWREISKIQVRDKTYYYLGNFSSIHNKNGEYAGLVMLGNDITREHEFNIHIAQQHDLLDKSNKAKENMLSILAHDLKDGIYSALTMSKLVTEEPDEFDRDELVRIFHMMHDNFEKTQRLLDGLLTWMKTQTGGLEANPSSFKLGEVIHEVVATCETKSAKKDIELKTDVDENFEVTADREMIKTVIRNLVTNAIKYTRSGEGEVQVLVEENHGDELVVHVVDNGQGMNPDEQRMVLNGPGKLTKPGTNNERGTGFGISLCKELLKLNESKLRLVSKVGEGTDFYFSLPQNKVNGKDE